MAITSLKLGPNLYCGADSLVVRNMLGSSVSIANSKVGVNSLLSPTVVTLRALLSSLELTREWTLNTLNLLVFLMMSALATGTKEGDTLLKQSAFKMSHLWGKEGSSNLAVLAEWAPVPSTNVRRLTTACQVHLPEL